MKQIFIIQKFNLKEGFYSILPCCFDNEADAVRYVDESKRICSETSQVDIDIIDQFYVYNVLPLDLLK